MKKKKKLGKGKGTDECSFGLVNGDFVLRGVAGADSNGLAEGSVGPSRWAHEPLSFFEAFARALKLVKFRNGIWSVNLLTYCEKEEHGVREKRKKIERKIRRSKGSKF